MFVHPLELYCKCFGTKFTRLRSSMELGRVTKIGTHMYCIKVLDDSTQQTSMQLQEIGFEP